MILYVFETFTLIWSLSHLVLKSVTLDLDLAKVAQYGVRLSSTYTH